ncbi:MAG TPA: 1,4-alpha-glucan branching protein GlgB [Polyangia bacterium]|nr:1,4-alpha-glucan branching protein GlgB [Polyangia bacterium]
MTARRPPPRDEALPPLGDVDVHLFAEGTHARMHDKLGAHLVVEKGVAGTRFAVWAPNAASVGVIGDFEGWGKKPVPLALQAGGIWEGFAPGVGDGARYKYRITSNLGGYRVDKSDPYAFRRELPPATASIVCALDKHKWSDDAWMSSRRARQALDEPASIYEVHLGSWMRVPEEENRFLTYRELAPKLAAHVTACGFTHVELLPIAEHPFYPSWGYQVTGFFAPTARYGAPEDFMWFVDYLHQRDIGVILDWTPAHFPTDEHGLIYFDGTHLYEHADPRQGIHAEWGSALFNYGRGEVRSFLVSNANFWLERYHVDGLRVDAVASMLYLDYGRSAGGWIPNQYGGRENLEAIHFLRTFNEAVYRDHPDTQTIAEESTSWPSVSRPTYTGGLGFGLKWDMGWMHDTLEYFAQDPIGRRYHHHKLTFRSVYFWSENFVLPLSHDEVVHGKRSLVEKLPGDLWQRFATMRLLFSMMWAQPGKKLLFQGGEFGQFREWAHDASLDWNLLGESAFHTQLMGFVGELNRLYREVPALHEGDVGVAGFEWIDANDAENSVYSFLRKGKSPKDRLLAVFNCTPIIRRDYRVGVPAMEGATRWRELLNSDAEHFGGSGVGNLGGVAVERVACHGRDGSVRLTLPPLAATWFVPEP